MSVQGKIQVINAENQGMIQTAQINANASNYAKDKESATAIQVAKEDAGARKDEAEYAYKSALATAEYDFKGKELEYKGILAQEKTKATEIAEVGHVNAMANLTSAQADVKEAEAKELKYELRYGQGSQGSQSDYYYYG
jgi:hypothetical protein